MRLRIYFSKSGSLRYIGHLDFHTLWERTIRRAGLPLLYTQGFHPGPRIQLASALPLGFIGRCEIIDIWLDDSAMESNVSRRWDRSDDFAEHPRSETEGVSRQVKDALQPAAPPGLAILSAEPVDEHSPALQTRVASADYEVTFLDPLSASEAPVLKEKVASLLAAASVPAERRGKPYDLRPLLESLDLVGAVREPPVREPPVREPAHDDTSVKLLMRLAAREGATGRPEAVLAALGIPFETTRIERIRIILKPED